MIFSNSFFVKYLLKKNIIYYNLNMMYMKKFKEIYYNLKIDKLLKIANYLKYFLFLMLLIVLNEKNFQNDTFYSIKIGEFIKNNGIDFFDHFCIVKNLSYQYPHFLYDLLIYIIYDKFNFIGIYFSTIIFGFINIICLYKVNLKNSNKYISFIITIFQTLLLIPFFTARAQIITFFLLILTYYFIEKFLKKAKLLFAIILIIIPILITNTHLAIFPFYFVIYLPYFIEYLISKIMTKKNNKLKYNRVIINSNSNVIKLFFIFIICLFTGFVTPLKNFSYIHFINLLKGNSLNFISEHQPLILINAIPYLIFLIIIFYIMIFSDIKFKLRDLFFFFGMTLLSFMSQRQISMSVIFNGFLLSKWLNQIILEKKLNSYQIYKFKKCIYLPIFTILILFILLLIPSEIGNINNYSFVNKQKYPIDLVKYIKINLNYTESRFFNEYDFGSYLLFNDIPVFIDSRADLYLKEFNNFEGNDIFTDYFNIYNKFDEIMKKYNFDYMILYKSNKLNILIEKAYKFEKIYEDSNFVLYKVIN